MSAIPSEKELNDRADSLRGALSSAQEQLGVALLRGEPGDEQRSNLQQIHSNLADVLAMLRARPGVTAGQSTARSYERDDQIAKVRTAARVQFTAELTRFKADVGKLRGAELKARASALHTLARRAGRTTLFREIMVDFAKQYDNQVFEQF